MNPFCLLLLCRHLSDYFILNSNVSHHLHFFPFSPGAVLAPVSNFSIDFPAKVTNTTQTSTNYINILQQCTLETQSQQAESAHHVDGITVRFYCALKTLSSVSRERIVDLISSLRNPGTKLHQKVVVNNLSRSSVNWSSNFVPLRFKKLIMN